MSRFAIVVVSVCMCEREGDVCRAYGVSVFGLCDDRRFGLIVWACVQVPSHRGVCSVVCFVS